MRAVLVGTVEGTRGPLRALARVGAWELAAVITLPPTKAARHSDYVDLTPDIEAAGADPIYARDINEPAVVERIRTYGPDFIFVFGWSQICRPPFLATARRGVIGFHPAALPRLRGRAPIPWTILEDEKITASTLFWIDNGVDTGPILLQRFFHVRPDETARTLYDKHVANHTAMIPEACALLASEAPPKVAQDDACATYGAKRVPADGNIDWRAPAVEIARLVRAVGPPYPGAYSTVRGRRLLLLAAEPRPTERRFVGLPGQVLVGAETGCLIRAVDGDLWVREWRWQDAASAEPPSLHQRLA